MSRTPPPSPARRRALLGLLGAAGGASLAGCVGWPVHDEWIVDIASGRRLGRAELLAALRASDHVLLGELHDNPRHHALRGALLAELAAFGPGPVVVAEHLDRGQRLQAGGPGTADADTLLQRLRAAGFSDTGWAWPLHRPLFEAASRAGLPVIGGNLSRDDARRVAREGLAAAPADLRALVDAAPLPAAAQAALDEELVEGHCGHLTAARVPAMRAAQRARDAAMWQALRDSGGRPGVLVAGNGHVRRDFGVPQIAAADRPALRVLSLGFVESAQDLAGLPYSHAWVTTGVERGDPCAGMRR